MGRGRRELVIQYAEFVAACKIMGKAHLLKGAPSIETMRTRENEIIAKKRAKNHSALTAIPFPPLESMIDAAEARFRRGGIPEDIEERIRKWAPLKEEELRGAG